MASLTILGDHLDNTLKSVKDRRIIKLEIV